MDCVIHKLSRAPNFLDVSVSFVCSSLLICNLECGKLIDEVKGQSAEELKLHVV